MYPLAGGNGHFYSVTENSGTWHEANEAAISYGGYLASITSAAEERFVLERTYRGAAWIGLTDERVEGSFEWTSGEPLAYTNWGWDEPDNGDDDWVTRSSYGEWWDRPADFHAVDAAGGHGRANTGYRRLPNQARR